MFWKIQLDKWGPSYRNSCQWPVNQQKPHCQKTERQSQSNKKKLEPKAYFSSKEERLFWILVFRKKNRFYKCILCRYLNFNLDWRNDRILKSTRYFSKKKDYSGSVWFVTRTKPNLSSTTSVFSAGIYLWLVLDWKDNRILEPTAYFSNEEKKFC